MINDFSNQRDIKIVIKEKDSKTQVDISNITYLECDGYITNIFLADGKKYTVSKLLKHYENALSKFNFVRVNHNIVVNMKHVLNLQEGSDRLISLTNKTKIQVSCRKLNSLKKILNSKLH